MRTSDLLRADRAPDARVLPAPSTALHVLGIGVFFRGALGAEVLVVAAPAAARISPIRRSPEGQGAAGLLLPWHEGRRREHRVGRVAGDDAIDSMGENSGP